jgi:superkiller protein 3
MRQFAAGIASAGSPWSRIDMATHFSERFPMNPINKYGRIALMVALVGVCAVARAAKPAVLVARPEGPQSTAWLGALIESHLHFRLEATPALSIVPVSALREHIDSYGDYSAALTERDYSRILSKFDVTHILSTTFALSDDGSEIQMYAELVEAGGDRFVDEQDISFMRAALNHQLDSLTKWLQHAVNVQPPSSLDEFYKTSITPGIDDAQTFFGQRLRTAYQANAAQAPALAADFLAIVRQDGRAGLANYYAGALYARGGAYDQAIAPLKKVVAFAPMVGRVYEPLCVSLRNAQQYDEALKYISRAEKNGVASPALKTEKALALAASGKAAEAAKVFESVLAHDKTNVDALVFFARRDIHDNRHASALSYADRALKQDKDNGQALLARAVSLAGLDRTDKAIDAYKRAAAAMSTNPEPFEALGDLYMSAKKHEQAAAAFSKAISLAPEVAKLYIKAADALEAAGKKQEALSALQTIEPSSRANATLQSRLGLLALELGDTATAYQHLRRYVKLEQKNGEALKALGDIYVTKREYAKAAATLEQALPLLSQKTGVRVSLGRLYLQQKEPRTALGFLKKALAADSDVPDGNRLAAEAYLMLDDKKSALTYFRAARKHNPQQVDLQRKIASLAVEIGGRAQAERELETLVARDTANGEALLQLATLKLKGGDFDKGDRYLKRALARTRPDRDMFMKLGDAFAGAKKYQRAADMYEHALRQDLQYEAGWGKLADAQLKAGADSAAAQSYLNLFGINNDKYKNKLAEAGHLLLAQGKKYKARQTYQLYLDKNYSDPEVIFNLAKIEYEDKQYDKAAALLDDIGGSYRANPEVAKMKAISYAGMEQYAKAIPALEAVMKRSPGDAEVLRLAARAYEKTKAYKDAADTYGQLLRQVDKEEQPDIAFRIGLLLEQADAHTAAIGQYAQNVRKYPADMRNYQRLGNLYFERKQYDRLIEALEPAVEKQGAPGDLSRMIAQAHIAKGEASRAVKHYELYLKKTPGDSLAWLELGSILFDQKQYPKAAEALKEACRLMPRREDCLLKLGIAYKEMAGASKKKELLGQAVQTLGAARQLAPADTAVLSHLADCYRTLGNSEQLVQVLRDWRSADAKNETVLLELGDALMAAGQAREALRILEEASKLRPRDVALHIKLAEAYGAAGDRKNRFAHLQSALAHDSKNPDLHLALARYHNAENQNDKALDYFKKAIRLDPGHAQAHYEYGVLLHKEGAAQLAHRHLSQAAKADASSPVYAFALSRIAHELGKQDEALRMARKAVELDGDNITYLSWTGNLYMSQGDNQSARKLFEEALAVDANCPVCHKLLGDIQFGEGAYPAAIESYRAALEAGGRNDTVALQLGRAHLMHGDFSEAIDVFEDIFKQDKSNSQALYWLVHTYLIIDKEGKAKRTVDKFRGRGDKDAWTHLAEGELYERAQNLNAAFISYSTAGRMAPELAQPFAGSGRVYAAREDYQAAILQFGQAMANEPNNVEFYLEMGQAYEATREFGSAEAIYQEILEKYPSNIDAYYYLARIYSKQDKHAKAVRAIKKGLELDDTNGKLYYALGHEYRIAKRARDAIEAYEQAVKHNGKDLYEAYRYMGLIYYHLLIDNNNAMKSFKKYVRAGGEDPDVAQLMEKIKSK